VSDSFEPKILAFLCNWCSYAGADLAGVSRFQYPPTIRVMRTMCSGRVDPIFILEGLRSGISEHMLSPSSRSQCSRTALNPRDVCTKGSRFKPMFRGVAPCSLL